MLGYCLFGVQYKDLLLSLMAIPSLTPTIFLFIQCPSLVAMLAWSHRMLLLACHWLKRALIVINIHHMGQSSVSNKGRMQDKKEDLRRE